MTTTTNETYFTNSGIEVEASKVTRDVRPRSVVATWFHTEPCGRCVGGKYFSCWAHIERGVCFGCGGSGIRHVVDRVYTAEEYAKRVAKREAKAARRCAEREAARKAHFAHAVALLGADLFERFDAYGQHFAARDEFGDYDVTTWMPEQQDYFDEFLYSLWAKMHEFGLSEKQAECVRRSFEAWDAKQAASATLRHLGTVGERRTFKGSILATRVRDGFSYGTLSYWALLADADGNLWSYSGSCSDFDAPRGTVIECVATVKAHETSKRGEPMTYGARPSKITRTAVQAS